MGIALASICIWHTTVVVSGERTEEHIKGIQRQRYADVLHVNRLFFLFGGIKMKKPTSKTFAVCSFAYRCSFSLSLSLGTPSRPNPSASIVASIVAWTGKVPSVGVDNFDNITFAVFFFTTGVTPHPFLFQLVEFIHAGMCIRFVLATHGGFVRFKHRRSLFLFRK